MKIILHGNLHGGRYVLEIARCVILEVYTIMGVGRAVTRALIGGGGEYSYIRVLPDEFLLKSVVIRVDFKRDSSGRTRIYEYSPPPQINALVTALGVGEKGI